MRRKSNELAWSASKSIADNPSASFNPLFIYGGAGLGKTHLIQAIGHQIREARPNMRVAYMSADSFVTELIASIRYDRMQSFRVKALQQITGYDLDLYFKQIDGRK